MIGSTVAHYRISAKIGEGGMGEVYRATDTKLGREVAIKVLPPQVSSDAQRMARFQREAVVLASLNHPNIATIYGVENNALIMELVEGETLAGPLPVSTAVHYARQITEALDYAHEKGVVHRDLKPANIKITPDGNIKILDFGLAKTIEPERLSVTDLASQPTVRATESGLIMGTPSYMAPEQVRGQAVDKRADIWAFGVVLYEMLTGKPLFEGETVSDILSEVLKKDIQFTSLPKDTPPQVRALLTRCIERDRKLRLRDLGDAWLESPQALPSTPATKPAWRFAAIAAGLAVAGLAAGYLLKPAPPSPRKIQFTLSPPPESTSPIRSFQVSPDGTQLLFLARNRNTATAIWLRDLKSNEARQIPQTDGTDFAMWSPDGKSILFHKSAVILRYDAARGDIQTICSPCRLANASWSESGTLLVSTGEDLFYTLPATGGTPNYLPRDVLRGAATITQLLSDGKRALFVQNDASLGYVSLESGQKTPLIHGVRRFEYMRGRIFYISDNNLIVQPFDERSMSLKGERITVASRVTEFSVSPGGVLVTQQGEFAETGAFGWFDRSGKLIEYIGAGTHNEVSPDGRFLAYDRILQANRDVWAVDIKRDTRQRLTTSPAAEWVPSWTPDSTHVVYTTDRKRRGYEAELYLVSANRAGAEELLFDDDIYKHHTHFSPDGKLLAFDGGKVGASTGIYFVPLDVPLAQRKSRLFLGNEFHQGQPQFSPDGKLLAYVTNETGRFEVYVHTVGGKPQRWRLSVGGGVQPRWRNDGKEIVFLSADGFLTSVAVKGSGEHFDPAKPVPMFQCDLRGTRSTTHFTMTSDAQRILLPARDSAPVRPITVTVNWESAQ